MLPMCISHVDNKIADSN